ncbi:MAG: septum formation initiator family protein [Actinobacteria bacterium]|nr:septum formation initiator family protein [Actinomycetota bacterium]
MTDREKPATRKTPATPGARVPLTQRPKLTGRAAVLAVVLCAIALSLAYPVQEYLAERRQIDQLQAQNAAAAAQVQYLQRQQRSMNTPARIEQEARDTLGMCFPSETCYKVITPTKRHATGGVQQATEPWYARLWDSVKKADGAQRK